ncbi:hypothetical protein [Paractinoplanes maris]|uniref:hypothetical protein n=1 Tax=Paractinoplanes maris TaxID=1734446 RepID=UPI0020220958|nr:hypothetical protein [Actinoplanes maris]
MSHPVPSDDQPSYGGYPPRGEYPPIQPGYPPAPGYNGQQYGNPPAPYGQQYPPQGYQQQAYPQQAYPQQPYPQQAYPPPHYAPQPVPQVVIQNNTTAAAFAGGYGLRKRQSFGLHVVLFFLTAGLGNILYAWYVIDWNRKRGL